MKEPKFQLHSTNEEDYGQPTFVIRDCNLYLTCMACPEQYDVFHEGKQIGYLRLRHGRFYAAYPDVGGKEVFVANPEKSDGIFDDDEIRMNYLVKAIKALLAEHYKNELASTS